MGIQFNTYTNGNQYDSKARGLSNGNFVVAWTDESGHDGYGQGIFAQVFYPNGAKFGNEFQVNSYTLGNQYDSFIASLNNSNFVVTWTDESGHDGYGQGIFAQVFYPSGAKLGSEILVNTYTNGNQFESCVLGLANGNFVVTWADESGHDGYGQGVFGQVFYPNGTKLGQEFLVNTYTNGNQHEPFVGGLINSNFVVSWTDDSGLDSYGQGIFGQIFYPNGTKIGGQFQLNSYATGNQHESSVAGSITNTHFYAVWTDDSYDGSGQGVFFQGFDSEGNKLSDETGVNFYAYSNQHEPCIASLSDGNGAITWTDDSGLDGFGQGICGRVLYKEAQAGQFQINSYYIGNQHQSFVAALSNGSFVVTWTDDSGLDGFGQGVFGKILYDTYTTLAPGTSAPTAVPTSAPTPVPTTAPTSVPATLAPTIAPTVSVTSSPLTPSPKTGAPSVSSFADDSNIFDTVFVIAGAATLFVLEMI